MKFLLLASLLVLSLASCATASNGADASANGDGDAQGEIADARPPQDDARACLVDPCQITPPCGCSGQVCDLDVSDLANGASTCRDVTIPGTESSTCTSFTQCAGGHVCLGGQCRAYCGLQTPCSNGLCIVQPVYDSGGGTFEPIPGVQACTKSCSPEKATDNGCPSSPQFGCHLVNHDPDGVAGNGDEFYYSDCRSAPSSGGGDGADCSGGGDSDCRPGFECVGLGGESVCKQLCIVPAGPCAIGSCSALSEGVVIDGVEYGVCL